MPTLPGDKLTRISRLLKALRHLAGIRFFLLAALILGGGYLPPVYSCTVVLAREGDRMLVGNNEDRFKNNAKYWYEAPEDGESYSALFFGFKGGVRYALGGMNEAMRTIFLITAFFVSAGAFAQNTWKASQNIF